MQQRDRTSLRGPASGFVIRLVALADGSEDHPLVGCYLVDYDPDGNEGWGMIDGSPNLDRARVFHETRDAMVEYGRISTVRPLRRDYKANRPLTAFTIAIIPLDRAREEDGEASRI